MMCEMGMESIVGQMEIFKKEIGQMENGMEKENFIGKMGTFIKEIGQMEK